MCIQNISSLNGTYVLNKLQKIIPYCYGLLGTNSTLNINLFWIHTSLKYGIICWGNSNKFKKLFTLHKSAIRYIVKAKKKQIHANLFSNHWINNIFTRVLFKFCMHRTELWRNNHLSGAWGNVSPYTPYFLNLYDILLY